MSFKPVLTIIAIIGLSLFSNCKKDEIPVTPKNTTAHSSNNNSSSTNNSNNNNGNNNNNNGNNDTTSLIDTAQLISEIGGIRHWTGTNSWNSPNGSGSVVVNDTFEVSILSQSMVSLKNKDFHISLIDTVQKIIHYETMETNTFYFLRYYYENDSMQYIKAIQIGVMSSNTLQLHTIN